MDQLTHGEREPDVAEPAAPDGEWRSALHTYADVHHVDHGGLNDGEQLLIGRSRPIRD